MTSTNMTATTPTIVFQSTEELQRALYPLNLKEVYSRSSLHFRFDKNLQDRKLFTLYNKGLGNQLKYEIHKTKTLTVYYPETPRVPHHLTIALNRKVKGITDITQAENHVLFATIKKIAEIYKSLKIKGFVISQHNTPQDGHLGRYVVEIIPHFPGFNEIKNYVDKIDCNRYVLFRKANLSPPAYKINQGEMIQHIGFWKSAFKQEFPPLTEIDTKITFPHQRKDAYKTEAQQILMQHVVEYLENKGGRVENRPLFEPSIPTKIPKEMCFIPVEKCAFCDEEVLDRQLVYEHENVCILYNRRKGAKPGSNFLILPKRHTERVYNLDHDEINNICVMRKALVEVLKDVHPECEVVTYIQDSPSVGQTVFHTHEQVVAIDPKTVALTWTFSSLYPNGNVSEEEILNVCQEFRKKLQQVLLESEEEIAL